MVFQECMYRSAKEAGCRHQLLCGSYRLLMEQRWLLCPVSQSNWLRQERCDLSADASNLAPDLGLMRHALTSG